MTGIAPVSHSPLTTDDIARLPKGAIQTQQAAAQGLQADTYQPGEKKSSALKKTIWTAAIAAAALVGLKYLGRNSFLKVADPNNMKFLDKVKNGIIKAADYIELPFVWSYNKVRGLFPKTQAGASS